MIRKRIFAALLAATMTFSIFGCGKSDDNKTTTSAVENTTTAPTESVETTTSEATQEPTKEEESSNIVSIPNLGQMTLPESDALTFVENLQLGWNLGNTFDATDDNAEDDLAIEYSWVGVKTTKEMLQTIADAGFKTIRIPVSWHNHVDADFKINEAWLNRVQEVVDWSLEAGLYVVINLHHDNEKGYMYPDYENLETSKKYVKAIWEQVSDKFADYDERLVFESLNEPRHKDTDHEWWINSNSAVGKEAIDCINQLNQLIVDTIRSQGSENNKSRYIMVPGYCASPDFVVVDNFVLPNDTLASKQNRILVSVHAYRPYNFALAPTTDKNSTPNFSLSSKADTSDLNGFMNKLYTKFTSKGIGVVIGEAGSMLKKTGDGVFDNNNDARCVHAAYFTALARYYGMTMFWWDNNAFTGNGELFGLLDRKRNNIMFPQIVENLVYYSKVENLMK